MALVGCPGTITSPADLLSTRPGSLSLAGHNRTGADTVSGVRVEGAGGTDAFEAPQPASATITAAVAQRARTVIGAAPRVGSLESEPVLGSHQVRPTTRAPRRGLRARA